jgi:hypothetical protein
MARKIITAAIVAILLAVVFFVVPAYLGDEGPKKPATGVEPTRQLPPER